jgi:DNA-binding response OmpR family regulator
MAPESAKRKTRLCKDCLHDESVAASTQMMNILLVEDEERIADFVTTGFIDAGINIECCIDGITGLAKAKSSSFDAIVLDLMLPGMDGLQILRNLREEGLMTPIVLLTAKTDLTDRLAGFDAGADDYLPKPFFIEELIVRIRTLVERRRGLSRPVLQRSGLLLNRISREASWAGVDAVLSQREFTLIEYLIRSPGHVFSRSQILRHVWGLDFDPKTNVVDVCIQRLKKKLTASIETDSKEFPIEAIRGIGYRFRED